MAVDIPAGILQWLINPIIWIVLILVVLGFVFMFLKIRVRRQLIFPAAELADFGNGKIGMYFLGKGGAGWFGTKQGPLGLWYYGDKVLRNKDMKIIQEFSEQDFQEINGKRGVVYFRDPEKHLLFPINKMKIDDQQLTAGIAPATYVDTSAELLHQNERETQNAWDKYLPLVAVLGAAIVLLISIVVIVQFVNHQTDAANELFKQAGSACIEGAKTVCSQIAGASNAP